MRKNRTERRNARRKEWLTIAAAGVLSLGLWAIREWFGLSNWALLGGAALVMLGMVIGMVAAFVATRRD